MRGRWNFRGLLAVAGVAVSLTAAAASPGLGLSAPEARIADVFETPVLIAEPGFGQGVVQQEMLRNPLNEVSISLPLSAGLTLDSGFSVDVGRMLERYAPTAFDGLFYRSLAYGSTYTSLSNGGSYLGLSASLADGLSLTLGHASSSPGLNRYLMDSRLALAAMGGKLPYDYRNTHSLVAGMSWDFARWGGVNLTASHGSENTLGLNSFGGTRTTSALGVSAHVRFGGGWVTTASYSEGLTQLELRPGAVTPDASVRTEAYGVAVAKHGLFSKNDALGVSFARPAPNFSNFSSTKGNELQFFGRDKVLNMTPETDIELGYKTEFFGDSVALQANASYQMNYGGMTGNNAVSLLSKAKIKF
jgi:hypothetical protein